MKKLLFPALVLFILLSGCTSGPFESSDQPAPQPLPEPKLLSDDMEFLDYSTRVDVVGEVQNEKLKELMAEMDDLLEEKADEMGVEMPAAEGEEVTFHDLDLKFYAEVLNEGAAGDITVIATLGMYPSTEDVVITAGEDKFTELKSSRVTVPFEAGEKKMIDFDLQASIREDLLVTALAQEQFEVDSIIELLYYSIEVEP
jgi:hypothetical protein